MPQVINTNVPSLTSQNALNKSQSALATSLQRLSTGLRINSAKDDAAGLAIAERFSTQIRGLNQASRNANDGISLAQTAEGALSEVTNNLQRIRELAVQSRNATNSASDRAALDSEVQQRIAEVNRVASQTQFNGLNLLNGTFTSQTFQIGANQGQTITVDSIAASTAQALGLNGGTVNRYNASGSAVTGNLAAGDLTINGVDIGAQTGDAKAIADAITGLDTRYQATATNSRTMAFTDVSGLGNNTLVSGAYATSTSQAAGINAAAGQRFSMSVDGVSVYSAQQETTLGSGGVFTTSEASAAGQVYQLSIGATTYFTQTSTASGDTITAAELDAGLNTAQLATDGFTVTGSAVGGDLTISRADGATFNLLVANTNGTTAGGFAGANYATGTNNADSGTQITVDAATIDGALATKSAALAAAGVTFSGSAATGDLKFTKLDNTNFDVLVTSNNTTNALGFTNGAAFKTGGLASGVASSINNVASYVFELDGVALGVDANINGTVTANEMVAAINEVEGFTASNNAGNITVTKSDGSNFTMSEAISTAPAPTGIGFADASVGNTGTATTFRGTVDLASQIAVTIGGNAPTNAGLTAASPTQSAMAYSKVNVLTTAAADTMLEIIDGALNNVSGSRANLGAIQNRFESVISNLATTSENMTASRSRIQDADFASETANMTRNQILQQAGTAMLAQANSLPQNVLSLLR